MPDAILSLNAGSSSIKFALFRMGAGRSLALLCRGEMEGIGTAPRFVARDARGGVLAERCPPGNGTDHQALLSDLLQWVESHLGGDRLVAAGHRVVHGGGRHVAPERLTPAVLQSLEALTPLAPLHQPGSLAPAHAIAALRPKLTQVACFDTAFHHTMPAVARRFALPRTYEAEGVRRYGFHGLSYEFIAAHLRETAPALAAGRIVVAHLGNGASLCAMREGRSLDTTMSFTALDGLVMGTRCGSIDPGVLLYMLQQKNLPASEVEHILYHQSGLLGVSGISSDMRRLCESTDPEAGEAVELFVYRIARETAALAAALGGLDGLVFTAGIGQHAAQVRAAVCERLGWLGIGFDAEANARHARAISAADSPVQVLVIPTDEETVIARHTLNVLNGTAKGSDR
jgi:acetate kinase